MPKPIEVHIEYHEGHMMIFVAIQLSESTYQVKKGRYPALSEYAIGRIIESDKICTEREAEERFFNLSRNKTYQVTTTAEN
jgi:hypothetical protein